MDYFRYFIWMISLAFVALLSAFVLSITGLPKFSSEEKISKEAPKSKSDIKTENPASESYALAPDPNVIIVKKHCTGCHSNRLITQNRNTRDGWEENIRWMQRTQGLWDLGMDEPIILDYLAKYYAPVKAGRRKNLNLSEEDWYVLKD